MFKMVNILSVSMNIHTSSRWHETAGGDCYGVGLQARAFADELTTAQMYHSSAGFDMIYKLKHDCNTSMILIT